MHFINRTLLYLVCQLVHDGLESGMVPGDVLVRLASPAPPVSGAAHRFIAGLVQVPRVCTHTAPCDMTFRGRTVEPYGIVVGTAPVSVGYVSGKGKPFPDPQERSAQK